MKKTITFLGMSFLMLGMVSCKKDYECTCVETDVWQGDVDSYQYSYSVKEANRTQAQAACNEATIRVEESANDYYEVTCELK